MTPIDPVTGRRHARLPLVIGCVVAAACLSAGVAAAQTPEPAESTETTETTQADLTGEPTGEEQGTTGTETTGEEATGEQAVAEETAEQDGKRRRLSLTLEDVSPRKIYFVGHRKARFAFKYSGADRANFVIDVMKLKDGDDKKVRRYHRDGLRKTDKGSVRWNGRRGNGDALKRGKFYFLVKEAGGRRLARKNAKGNRNVKMYPAKFPVRGPHQYWDGWGAGRGHQGQDIGADCGTPMVAAEPGKVAYKGYDGGGWGYYVVINVKRSNHAILFSHLKGAARVASGSTAKTGERIGQVGQSGNAQGCHLHFEYWKGGWPNGSASSVATRRLKRWDSWS